MKITYEKDGNVITHYHDGVKKYEHYKDSNGIEWWREYDASGNKTHHKNSNGIEWWREYDASGNQTHYKDSNGIEWWREYDASGKPYRRSAHLTTPSE